MGLLKFDFDKANAQIRELEEIAAEIEQLASTDYENLMQEMRSAWKGSAADAYMRKASTVQEKIKKTALEINKILGCTGFARVDMFYTKDKKIVFNEVNTIPGCTSHSRYPSMLNKIGISFPKVIDKLIKLGLER